jgi:hypothetical protein
LLWLSLLLLSQVPLFPVRQIHFDFDFLLAEEPYTAEDFAQEEPSLQDAPNDEEVKQQQFNAFACIMYTKVRFQQQNEEVNNIIKTVQAHDTQAVYKKMFAQHMAYCMMVIQHSEAEDVMKPFFRGINVSQLFLRVLYDFLSGFKRSDH